MRTQDFQYARTVLGGKFLESVGIVAVDLLLLFCGQFLCQSVRGERALLTRLCHLQATDR